MFKLSARLGVPAALELTPAQEFIRVGREVDNDFIADNRRVSSHHCELRQEDGAWVLVDLHSTNGTSIRRADRMIAVNRHRDFRVKLNPRDEIVLGDPPNAFHIDFVPVTTLALGRSVQLSAQMLVEPHGI